MTVATEEIPITYDRWGRMMYHPDFHFNHKKPWPIKERAFIAQNYRRGEVKNLSMVVGRTEHCIRSQICSWRRSGQYDRLLKINIGDWEPEEQTKP